jgi:D-alanyl-D-alanine carboxypeptidase/D-alanyl-D-alanine-endopeptidase (penicillin-binding protein 4)
LGLAPASCQKIFTSIAAFDLLGHDYRFATTFGYDGTLQEGVLNGNLWITGHGDPTTGSWRYDSAREKPLLSHWIQEIQRAGIRKIQGQIILNSNHFSFQPTPGGWTWNDMGNYYGAGHWALNWHENQFDLFMHPGDLEGDTVAILRTEPSLRPVALVNLLRTGKRGSGDQATVYLPPYGTRGFVEGTVPAGEKEFHVSGALPDPLQQWTAVLSQYFGAAGLMPAGFIALDGAPGNTTANTPEPKPFYTYRSPSLDTVNFYFLKKSVNLYGEALLRTIAYEKNGFGNTDSGLGIIRRYWEGKGIDKASLHMIDGSGLSPQNRVTTRGLVTALQYAASCSWFPSFYNALPEYNGMKLKSGTIGGAKSFAGFHRAADGTPYTVAIIVNGFDGSASSIVKKMFAVLDGLK